MHSRGSATETYLSMLGNGILQHRSELESWQGAIACNVYFCINFQKSASDNCCCGAADSACTDCLSEMPTGLISVFVLREGLLVDAGTLSGCCTGSVLEELALLLLSVAWAMLPELARLVILAASASRLCCCCSLAQRASRDDAAGAFAMPAVITWSLFVRAPYVKRLNKTLPK